ncbi:hypothetical protein [Pseudotamlana carrageenivorans]|uniref:STAS domain-containing protein n=1 Tax=Pseudotamlana carrageenivorans TaxID=2069432 RepID=A0A2I7SHT8_9FLAO|nr:hypothetical protein [Tamlana carrageenivorans]AUS05463.1 hypothetical protein C1A40_08270 [Tamlana carrageenivorans]
MDLEITSCNNFYKVKGHLNKSTVGIFINEFDNIFNNFDSLTISIKDVESMDKYGVEALSKLHTESLMKNKQFSIIGYGCKELYDHFKTEIAA